MSDVKESAKSGLLTLFFRSGFVYILRACSILFLARWLDPKDYGIFAIVNSWVWGANLFLPDLSLEAALIQKKDVPTKDEMRSFWAISLYRGFFMLLAFILTAPWLLNYHDLNGQYFIYLFIGLAFSMLLNSLRIPPRMKLERELNFKVIIFIEIFETIVLFGSQLIFAYLGYGVWTFIISYNLRSLSGFVLTFYYCPEVYLPVFKFNKIKGLLNFGIPTQIKKIVLAGKSLIVPIVLANWLIPEELGIVTWTISIASIPSVLADNYDRVLFPSLSRLQSNMEEFKKIASRGIEVSVIIFAFVFGMIACSSESAIMFFFPDKWAKAIGYLPIAVLSVFLSRYRLLFASMMNARGKPKLLLYLEAIGLILEFSFTWYLTNLYGGKGFLWGIVFSEVIVCIFSYIVNIEILRAYTLRRIFCSFSAAIVSYYSVTHLLRSISYQSLYELIVCIFSFSLVYFLSMLLMDFKSIKESRNILFDILGRILKRKSA